MSLLEVKNLSVRYGERTVVDDLSFSVNSGDWLMIVGPNGAGKTSVVNAVSQTVASRGEVFFEGRNVKKIKPRQLAKSMGVLSQNHFVAYSFTVEDIIRLGRYPYSPRVFGSLSDGDREKISRAVEMTGMKPFLTKPVTALSGGELQRTFLAQVFAQDPRLLILDEPVNHLDLVYQKQTFELVQKWLSQEGRAVISVVHDLSLAKAYGTHALLMDRGRAVCMGRTADVLTNERLCGVYSMDVAAWMKKMLSQWQ